MEVANFTSDVRFLSGAENSVADIMSKPDLDKIGTVYKLPAPEVAAVGATEEMDGGNQDVAFETVDHNALAQAQLDCPEVVTHRAGQHPRAVNMRDVEFTPGTTLFCEMASGKARPFVPKNCREKVILMFHGLSHPGPAKTSKKVSSRYYWPSLGPDVAKLVKSCHGCQAAKSSKTIVLNYPTDPLRLADYNPSRLIL